MALDKGNAARRVISILVVLVMLCLLPVSNGVATQAPAVLNVAYQYGLAYAPLIVMKEYGMIQKHYDGAVEVNWQVLNSGVAINEGIVAGQIDVGAMGVAPAIVGVMRGIPYKIFSNISSQPHGLMTNSTDIQTLSDITSDKKIALVGIGSIQHIFLSMLALHDLGDAHALDNNIIAMSHPDGMTALISGAVDCQLTTSPYLFYEYDVDNLHEVSSLEAVWPNGNSFIVGMASNALYDGNPQLYRALVEALAEAEAFIEQNADEAAGFLATYNDVSKEVMLSWLNDPGCSFSPKLQGAMSMAAFMAEYGFIADKPDSVSKIAYDNVEGE